MLLSNHVSDSVIISIPIFMSSTFKLSNVQILWHLRCAIVNLLCMCSLVNSYFVVL